MILKLDPGSAGGVLDGLWLFVLHYQYVKESMNADCLGRG